MGVDHGAIILYINIIFYYIYQKTLPKNSNVMIILFHFESLDLAASLRVHNITIALVEEVSVCQHALRKHRVAVAHKYRAVQLQKKGYCKVY